MNDEVETDLRVMHIYEHDKRAFEIEVNEALRRITAKDGVVADVQYAIDNSTERNARGGFGALIVYEVPSEADAG